MAAASPLNLGDIPAVPLPAQQRLQGGGELFSYQGQLFWLDTSGKLWALTVTGASAVAWATPSFTGAVTAADTSVVVAGTTAATTIRTNTLDVIATQHPPAANWSNNSHKITAVSNGSAATDAAAFGQVPVIGGTNFAPVIIGTGSVSAAQTANLLILQAVNIPVAVTVTGLVIVNGATATGNVLVALYSADGTTLLGSSSSTGQSGTNSTQDVAFTAPYAAPAGSYITGVIYSSSSATAPLSYLASPASTAAQGGFSLPSTVTPPVAGAAAALAVAGTY